MGSKNSPPRSEPGYAGYRRSITVLRKSASASLQTAVIISDAGLARASAADCPAKLASAEHRQSFAHPIASVSLGRAVFSGTGEPQRDKNSRTRVSCERSHNCNGPGIQRLI